MWEWITAHGVSAGERGKGNPNSFSEVQRWGQGLQARKWGPERVCTSNGESEKQDPNTRVCKRNRRARKKEHPDAFPREPGNGRAKTGGGVSKETGRRTESNLWPTEAAEIGGQGHPFR